MPTLGMNLELIRYGNDSKMNKAGLSWWVGFFLICLVQIPDVHAVTLWKSHYYYRAGSLVSHNSDDSLIKYRAIKPSKNKNPAQYPDYWKPVSVINGKNQIPEDETAIETGAPAPPAVIVPPSEDVFSDSQVVTEEIGSPDLPDIRLESPALIDTGSPLIPDTSSQDSEVEGVESRSAADEWYGDQPFFLSEFHFSV